MVLRNRGVNEKSHHFFSGSRLKFVMQGSNSSVAEFFFKVRIAKMRVLGWLDAFRAVKLALKHSCEKASLRL